jgi:hypothetical protein
VTEKDDDAGSHNVEIWREIRRISESLIAIHTKIDTVLPKIEDHESRLRKLEERRFPYSSIAAITAVVSVVVAILGVYLKK